MSSIPATTFVVFGHFLAALMGLYLIIIGAIFIIYRIFESVSHPKLVFQAADRYHIYSVFSAVSIVAYGSKYHHERWSFHLGRVYLICKSS